MNYHEKEAINNPSSVERIMIDMHNDYQLRKVPMSYAQTDYLISILMTNNDEQVKTICSDLASQSYQFGGFFKRCEMFPIKYDAKLKLWLALLNYEYGIGAMILVAYYVQWWAYATDDGIRITVDKGILTLQEVAEHCFPFGVFDEETIKEFWDKQKVKASPDNLIDHFTACYSFMPVERKEPISSKDQVWS